MMPAKIKLYLLRLHEDAYATARELSKADERDWNDRERELVEKLLLRVTYKSTQIREALK